MKFSGNSDPAEFGRVISNLINNSVESLIDNKGSILVTVKSHGNMNLVEIRDNGRGISTEVLAKFGKEQVSFGKSVGHGLGISHAYKTIETCNGKIEIDSKIGSGTLVKLILPSAPRPNWFVEKIFLSGDVCVIDDDPSIFEVWKNRLVSSGILLEENLIYFSSGEDFLKWSDGGGTSNLYLVDYEMLGQSFGGLELTSRAGISQKSILVTSRYEEEQIRQSARGMEVRLIPKSLVPLVPIESRRT
jgi:hypothetical protein